MPSVTPFAIGGDHSVTLAELRAVAPRLARWRLSNSIRTPIPGTAISAGKRYSAGTPFRQSRRGGTCRAGTLDPDRHAGIVVPNPPISPSRSPSAMMSSPATSCSRWAIEAVAAAYRQRDRRAADASSPSTWISSIPPRAPGVQTPEAGGPNARETLELLRRLHDIRLVGCDVVEINPLLRWAGQITALLAATVMAELLALIATPRQQ